MNSSPHQHQAVVTPVLKDKIEHKANESNANEKTVVQTSEMQNSSVVISEIIRKTSETEETMKDIVRHHDYCLGGARRNPSLFDIPAADVASVRAITEMTRCTDQILDINTLGAGRQTPDTGRAIFAHQTPDTGRAIFAHQLSEQYLAVIQTKGDGCVGALSFECK